MYALTFLFTAFALASPQYPTAPTTTTTLCAAEQTAAPTLAPTITTMMYCDGTTAAPTATSPAPTTSQSSVATTFSSFASYSTALPEFTSSSMPSGGLYGVTTAAPAATGYSVYSSAEGMQVQGALGAALAFAALLL